MADTAHAFLEKKLRSSVQKHTEHDKGKIAHCLTSLFDRRIFRPVCAIVYRGRRGSACISCSKVDFFMTTYLVSGPCHRFQNTSPLVTHARVSSIVVPKLISPPQSTMVIRRCK